MQQVAPYTGDSVLVRTLSNGLTVTMEVLPYLHSVAAGVWVKTGSANEQPQESGIAHFLEHLFFKGTTTRSAHELMDAIERRGGHMNAFTSRDHTCVYVKLLDTHIAAGLEILGDVIKNSQFFDLEKERGVVLEEIASIEDVPEDFVHDLLALRLWPNHALGRPVTGSIETVSKLGLDDVRGYFNSWYRPQNLIVSVAGNFDDAAMFDQICAEFESLTPATVPDGYGPPEFGHGIQYYVRDIAQSHLCLGFPGPAVDDPRRYTYDVLSSTLGGGATSRLFERIRENAGLAYSIYAHHSCYLTSGMLGVYSAVAPENLTRALDMIFEEIRRLRDELISDKEMELNREQLKGNLLMALESTSNRMSRMAKCMMFYGRIVPVEETIAAIDAVTAEDIRQLAQEIFRPEHCSAAILGPDTGTQLEQIPL